MFWLPAGLDASQTEATGGLDDTPWSSAVVLENVPEHLTQDHVMLLVDSIGSHSEDEYSLEFIPELKTAVVTFNDPSGTSFPCKAK